MIIVITTKERDELTGKETLVISHGVQSISGRPVALPCEKPEDIGAVWSDEHREYVLYEPHEQAGPVISEPTQGNEHKPTRRPFFI